MKSFGLIGEKLGHSFSKKYFEENFGKRYSYELFEMEDILGLRDFIDAKKDLAGLNVTIPFKQEVIPFLDEISPISKKIGAVNVIEIIRHSGLYLIGHNTDAPAFEYMLKKDGLDSMPALILGDGGVAQSIRYCFNKLETPFLQVSRSPSKKNISYENIDSRLVQKYPLIINTTPLGAFPDIDFCPKLPYDSLNERNVLFDLNYNPAETVFMKKGREQGARVFNGLEMLMEQAKFSWRIWGI